MVERILEAARSTGANAIRRNNFLSENADFAEAVEAAGITFIGPKPDSIRTMGDKLSAEAVAQQNVPLSPGRMAKSPTSMKLSALLPRLVSGHGRGSAGGGGKACAWSTSPPPFVAKQNAP